MSTSIFQSKLQADFPSKYWKRYGSLIHLYLDSELDPSFNYITIYNDGGIIHSFADSNKEWAATVIDLDQFKALYKKHITFGNFK